MRWLKFLLPIVKKKSVAGIIASVAEQAGLSLR